jgi:CxxC-x17-CxxC domain-containing protein
MAREFSRDRRDSPRRGSDRGGFQGRDRPRRDSGRNFGGNRDFDRPRSGGFSRDRPRRDSRRGDRRDVVKTKVTCSSCGTECEVPFKPTSSKPVYCDDCFAKRDKKGSNDLTLVHEKLDKIMKALKIE